MKKKEQWVIRPSKVIQLTGVPKKEDEHNCFDHAVEYESDGVLGHGWECGLCGKFLQAG